MIKFKGHSDGKAIIPDEPVEIPTGKEYTVSLVEIDESGTEPPGGKKGNVDALAEILKMARPMGPKDLSVNFRKYTGRVLDCDEE